MPTNATQKINLTKRHRRVYRFFFRTLVHAFWWDVILKLPVLRLLRKPPIPRWQKIARRYRGLAVDLGGVLIKLGQFLSIRVDVLPREITKELANLQDEVPPEPFKAIHDQLIKDFKQPLNEMFNHIDPEPLGSASLAQVHAARTKEGTELVLKVLRPGIEALVETDLSAVRKTVKWLKLHKTIRRRVDLDHLVDEFSTVTRNELDLSAEAQNARRFASDFADDPTVCIPRIFEQYSEGHILALEKLDGIKITEQSALEKAGIGSERIANTLYDIYMKQVFETYFVHADPHPGNLFVILVDQPDISDDGPDLPFRIGFVDFGMMAAIPDRLRSALREYAIGVGTRDVYRIVQSYVDAGILMPDADTKLIEEAHEMLFKKFWGVRVADLKDTALAEMRYFIREYREVIFEAPFQIQVDLLFVMRAMGILAGLATHLDPEFDPWSKTIPYAERYAKEKLKINRSEWRKEAEQIGQMLVKMPSRMDRALSQFERGDMMVQSALSPGARKAVRRLEKAVSRLGWIVGAVGCLLAGTLFSIQGEGVKIALFLFIAAAMMFIGAIRTK